MEDGMKSANHGQNNCSQVKNDTDTDIGNLDSKETNTDEPTTNDNSNKKKHLQLENWLGMPLKKLVITMVCAILNQH